MLVQSTGDSARALLKGIALLTLTLAESERHFITVREYSCSAIRRSCARCAKKVRPPENGQADEQFYNENRTAVENDVARHEQSK
jgi:hypothetical protein